MTTNERFKQRVRERMAGTGERYTAARRVLIEQTARSGRRVWASEPEHTDEVIRAKTGRGWDDWCDLIDAWPGHTASTILKQATASKRSSTTSTGWLPSTRESESSSNGY